MFYPLALFIGLRYTRARRRSKFISFISISSILGIALGVTALITIISVMNGFERELRHRILGMISHATVTGNNERLNDWQSVAALIQSQPQVTAVAPYLENQGMLAQGTIVTGVTVRGILPEYENTVSILGKKLEIGNITDLRATEFGILLGADLARHLGVILGDKITLVTPQAVVTPAGLLPRLKRFTVVGIFHIGMYEHDSALAVIHLQDAVQLFRYGKNTVGGIRIALNDLYTAPQFITQLATQLPESYKIESWVTSHANFFQAVHTEQTVMFIILTLIVAVAAFNIVSMLVMVVTDKAADIAILRTLGLSARAVMAIFIVQGTVIGIIGTIFGLCSGVLLASNIGTIVPVLERLFNFQLFSPDIYYINGLPSDLQWLNVIYIGLIALSLCVIATIYPAWRAARIKPAAALRYR